MGYFLDATVSLTLHDSMGYVSQTPVNTDNRHFSVSYESQTLIHYRQPRFTDTGFLRAAYD